MSSQGMYREEEHLLQRPQSHTCLSRSGGRGQGHEAEMCLVVVCLLSCTLLQLMLTTKQCEMEVVSLLRPELQEKEVGTALHRGIQPALLEKMGILQEL